MSASAGGTTVEPRLASGTPLASDAPGPKYGRFSVQRLHAKGGLGEVHIATDEELRRKVALKRMQADCAADPAACRRFLNEAESTARLEHPGIVPIYGLVQDEHGQPCYAMRFIAGQSLSEVIGKFHSAAMPRGQRFMSLEFRALLQRFISVCQTIAYAHSERVIHRDIKPANIMLGPFGETLVVDWGLARQLAGNGEPERPEESLEAAVLPSTVNFAPSGSDERVYTQAGQALGTLGYMAPEQAAGRWNVVGPCSDIYSLGATLYEMLTGQRPIRGHDRLEALQMAQAADFPSPRSVVSDVPKALEAICLKAMAAKPQDRYGTAIDLAADVEHWLADDPVSAYAESAVARTGRWGRKHKLVVTATAALFLAASPLSVLLAVNSEHARQQADMERIEIAKEKGIAEHKEKEATLRADETEAVLEFVEKKIFAAARPEDDEGGRGRDVKLREAIEDALPYVATSFTDRPLIEARLRATLGVSFGRLGDKKRALEQYERAGALYIRHRGPDHRDTLRCMCGMAFNYTWIGQMEEALQLNQETLALQQEKLGPNDPDTLRSMENLGWVYAHLGRHRDALNLRERTVALAKGKLGPDHRLTLSNMRALASSYHEFGREADALKLCQDTLAAQKAQLGADDYDTVLTMGVLASIYMALARDSDALKVNEDIFTTQRSKLGPDHPMTIITRIYLGDMYNRVRCNAEALKFNGETIALSKAKLGDDHRNTLESLGTLAQCYHHLGRDADALKLYKETLALRKAKYGAEHPQTLINIEHVAYCYSCLGRYEEALELREETVKLLKLKLGADHPMTLDCMFSLALSYGDVGRLKEAVTLHEETLALRKKTLGVDHRSALQSMTYLAGAYARVGRHADALKLCEETLGLKKAKLGPQDRDTIHSIYNLACLHALMISKSGASGKHADLAMACLREAVAAGWKNVAHMKTDKDLDALRDREDFKILVKELEQKK